MGTSGDYEDAVTNGSNQVRVGTILFGKRNYKKWKKLYFCLMKNFYIIIQ